MPMYDFKCEKCNKVFEELVRHSKIDDVKCKDCAGKVLMLLPLPNILWTESKLENFDIRAGHNMERAKKDRQRAEDSLKGGEHPYANWSQEADLQNDANWGEVK